MSNQYPRITMWVLGQASYNQPNAMVAAYEQFIRQETPETNGHLVIVDSSAKPSDATRFYQNVMSEDPSVHYFHIPYRPGREKDEGIVINVDAFPLAYLWMQGPFGAIYDQTIPTDEELQYRYTMHRDVQPTILHYHPRAHAEIMASINKPTAFLAPQALWADAVAEYTRNRRFHTRPHLGSIRNFIAGVTDYLGAQAVVNLDDDHIGEGYVQSQLIGLDGHAFTAKMKYLTLLHTDQRREKGLPPLWAVTDLNDAEHGYQVDFHGNRISGHKVVAQKSMGWTQARRVGADMPQVMDILGGEDRGAEARFRAAGHSVNLQTRFCPHAVRLIFGNGTSNNLITHTLKMDDHLLPPKEARDEILNYVMTLNASDPVEPLSREEMRRRASKTAKQKVGETHSSAPACCQRPAIARTPEFANSGIANGPHTP